MDWVCGKSRKWDWLGEKVNSGEQMYERSGKMRRMGRQRRRSLTMAGVTGTFGFLTKRNLLNLECKNLL